MLTYCVSSGEQPTEISFITPTVLGEVKLSNVSDVYTSANSRGRGGDTDPNQNNDHFKGIEEGILNVIEEVKRMPLENRPTLIKIQVNTTKI